MGRWGVTYTACSRIVSLMRIEGIFGQSGLSSVVGSRTERESGCQNPPMMSSLDKDVGDDTPALVPFVEYHTEYTPLLPLFPSE